MHHENKKGAVQFELPLKRCSFQDAVVNVSTENCTNIPEVAKNNNAIF
jgi:hypothetical protein